MPEKKDFTQNMGEKWKANSFCQEEVTFLTLLAFTDGRQPLISALLTG